MTTVSKKKPRGRHGPVWDLGQRAFKLGCELMVSGEKDGMTLCVLKPKSAEGFDLEEATKLIDALEASSFAVSPKQKGRPD